MNTLRNPNQPAAWVCLALAFAMLGHAIAWGQQQGPPPAKVRFGKVAQQQVQQRKRVIGWIAPVRTSVVAAEEAGYVIQAPPDAGTAVKAGDVLIRLDTELLKTSREVIVAQIAEAQAAIDEAQATYDQAVTQKQRYEKLVDSGAVTKSDYDQTLRDVQVTSAKLATAKAAKGSREAELKQLDLRLKKMVVTAPFAGSLITKQIEVGQWANPGTPIAELVETGRVDATLNVPERWISQLKPGDTLVVTVDSAGGEWEGKIHRIIPQAHPQARTFPVIVRLDNPENKLRAGMTAEAMVPIGRQMTAITVPRSAVQVTQSGSRVVVERDAVAAYIAVELLFTEGDRFVVEGQLKPDEPVVIEGNKRVFPGQPLKDINAPEAPTQKNVAPEKPTKQ